MLNNDNFANGARKQQRRKEITGVQAFFCFHIFTRSFNTPQGMVLLLFGVV